MHRWSRARSSTHNLTCSIHRTIITYRKNDVEADFEVGEQESGAIQHIFGANAITAVLSSSKRKSNRLYTYGRDPSHSRILPLARSHGIEILDVENKGVLNNLCGNRPHNGFVLECSALPEVKIAALGNQGMAYRPIAENANPMTTGVKAIGAERGDGESPPLYVLLDEVTDPQNMGSIIRTAYFLGAAGLILSKKNCASLSPVVTKASSGATEFLSIYHVQSTVAFIKASRRYKWSFVAASSAAMKHGKHLQLEKLKELARTQPVCIVFGSEGTGIRTLVARECAFSTSIEAASQVHPAVDSLNVGCAAAILLSAMLSS